MNYGRNILRLKEILGKKLRATGRDLLSKEEISYDRKKFPVTGRNVLSQEERTCQEITGACYFEL